MMTIHEFLRSLYLRRENLRRARDQLAGTEAPDFNPFEFDRITETWFARKLKQLLDPKGTHGQGSGFLQAFLSMLGAPWSGLSCEGVRVRVEVPTHRIEPSRRRIDILLEGENWILAIELKAGAADQWNQVSDYLGHVEEAAQDLGPAAPFAVLYLSIKGGNPAPHSIPATQRVRRQNEGQLLTRSYWDLLAWLAACKNVCRAPRVTYHLADLQSLVAGHFLKEPDMTEHNDIIGPIIGDPEQLEPFFWILENQDRFKAEWLGKLAGQIQDAFGKHEATLGWTAEADYRGGDYPRIYIGFADPGLRGIVFGFEFWKPHFTDLACGLRWVTGKPRSYPELTQAMIAAIGEGRAADVGVWPWWTTVHEKSGLLALPQHWDRNMQPWRRIEAGTLHPLVIAAARRVHDALTATKLPGIRPGLDDLDKTT